MPKLRLTLAFEKDYARLDDAVKRRVDAAITRFFESPKHPGLQLERRRGMPDYWTIRASKNHRIVLRRLSEADTYELVCVGDHDYVDKKF